MGMEERSGTLRRILIAIGLGLALCALAAPTALAKKPKKVRDTTTWLCKPGIPDNPCEPGFDTTLVSPSGQITGTENVKPDKKRSFDCFYVYPTVSDDKGTNSDLSIDPEERSIALYQAARYSLHCRVFAPMYRQLTLSAIGGAPSADAAQLAYNDVLAAWTTYLRKYNRGRGVVLIGHSQGSFMLRELIHRAIDRKKKVRRQLISAILLGGNVTVASGRTVGGDFKNVPGCRRAKQFGCVMAFSTFNAPVPARHQVRSPERLRHARSADDRRRALHEPGGPRRRVGSAHLGLPDAAVRSGNHDRPGDQARGPADAERRDDSLVPGPGLHGRL